MLVWVSKVWASHPNYSDLNLPGQHLKLELQMESQMETEMATIHQGLGSRGRAIWVLLPGLPMHEANMSSFQC